MAAEAPPPVVLFVDDEKHVVESLKDALRRLPMTILTATSAAGALRILDATAVDVVVSDELMPKMSGTELLAEVRRLYPDVVRIVLTGHASVEGAIKAINEGEIYRFLSKPCKVADLAQTIFEAVRVRRLADSSRRLLKKYRSASRAFQELERSHPGISKVLRGDDGSILVSPTEQSLADLIRQIESHLDE